ncbi:hypothetical protein Tco_0646923 [Tanacetum coccineum]
MALTEAVKEAIWLRGLLEELGIELNNVAVNCDNKGDVLSLYGLEVLWIRRIDLYSSVVFGECRHGYDVYSLMDTTYWSSEQLIDVVAALVKVAEESNVRTLPSFHCPCQHDIVERSSQPSISFALIRALLIQHGCEAALEVLPTDMEAQTKDELNKKAHSAMILRLGNKVLREVTKETTAAGI